MACFGVGFINKAQVPRFTLQKIRFLKSSVLFEPTGVADQLQTNFASDLRSILKTVFEVTSCNPMAADDSVFTSPTPSTSTSNPDPEQCAAPPSTASNSVASVRPDRGGSSSGSHRSGRAAEGSRQGAGSEGRERHRHRSNSSHRSRRSNYDGELRDNVSLRT